MRGLSTVLITLGPEASRQMRPPRAMHPVGFRTGDALGNPGARDLQLNVLRDALLLLKDAPHPGEIIERTYPDYK